MRTNVERKKIQPTRDTPSAVSRADMMGRGTIPNSFMASLAGEASSGYATPDFERRMMARMDSVQERSQAQIPQAESEADRLSVAVNAGTPESVKAVMGQRMGADFSGVRFHTGAAAAAKADAMGARAYTSGADVYFGSGGFDASVAAHELVHTAQQGMVDSGVPTLSTPVGGVQMKPLKLKNHSYRRSYRDDTEYQELVGMVKRYNKASGDDKTQLEMKIMQRAADYIQTNSTGAEAKHKGRTANLEKLIYQISAQHGNVGQARSNVEAMQEGHTSSAITGGLSDLESGMTKGKIMGQKISPAMRAIITENLAGNDKTVLNEANGNGFHLSSHMAGGSKININTAMGHNSSVTAALLHEMTHAQIYNTYGSTIAATEEQRRNPQAMQQEEKRRGNLMKGDFNTALDRELDDPNSKLRSGIASLGAKAFYGLNGGLIFEPGEGDTYLKGAITGASEERDKETDERIRDDWARYTQSLQDYNDMRNANLGDATDMSAFTGGHGAAMIEHDPAMVEHLMNFELNTPAKHRDKSQVYRILKAEALRGHVARHNENLRNKRLR